jgi:ribose transport system ATP-binding protein
MLPTNRKENSVIPDQSILENMYIAEQTLSAAKLPINVRAEKEKYENYKKALNLKAESSADPILSLSGGNQQKVFIARWLNTGADILLFDNPTQGIDVGAKAEIYRLILTLAEQGKTILINTLEIPELQKVADRCVIFYNGSIIKTLSHSEIEETTVMLYSTNAVNKEVRTS